MTISTRLRSLFPLGAAVLALALGAVLLGKPRPGAECTLTTTPEGATVFLDGILAGVTPLCVAGLPPGNHSLRLEKSGFQPEIVGLKLPPEGKTISVALRPSGTATLSVDLQPAGAEVLLDSEVIGHVPVRVSISTGTHELTVRKTNYKSYNRRIEARAGQQVEFKGEVLEDLILTMLKSAIETEKWRIAHYADLGHYFFINNRMQEAGDAYCEAFRVAAQPLVLPPGTPFDEAEMERGQRGLDVSKLNDEVKHIVHAPTLVAGQQNFRDRVREAQKNAAFANIVDWEWVEVQAMNYYNEREFAEAEHLYEKYIEVQPRGRTDQAYIGLLSVRLRQHNIAGAQQAYEQFSAKFKDRPDLVRQAANTIYSAHGEYHGAEETAVLEMAEKLLSHAVAVAVKNRGEPELTALCQFELANVYALEKRCEDAVKPYVESINGENEPTTKELRIQKLIDCLRALGRVDEAKEYLRKLAESPRDYIRVKAQQDLKALEKKH